MICQRCGRDLKNPNSVKIGLGPVCLRKLKKEQGAGKKYPRLLEDDLYVGRGGNLQLPKP